MQLEPPPLYPKQQYRPVSLGEWILTWIVLTIPVVNLVMACIWAFSDTTQPSKKTFCQATLIVWAAAAVLGGVLFAALVAIGAAASMTSP